MRWPEFPCQWRRGPTREFCWNSFHLHLQWWLPVGWRQHKDLSGRWKVVRQPTNLWTWAIFLFSIFLIELIFSWRDCLFLNNSAIQILWCVVTWMPLSMETWTNQGILLEQFPPTLAMVVTCWLETEQGPVRTMDSGPAANQSVTVSVFFISLNWELRNFQLLWLSFPLI